MVVARIPVKRVSRDCCDKWWSRLSTYEKEWVHYCCCDIERQVQLVPRAPDIHEMHEFRFVQEGCER